MQMSNRQKPISDIMTRELCQVAPGQSAIDALARMRSRAVSSVLVIDDGVICGIITERDIVRAVRANKALRSMGCVDLMQSPVLSVGPSTPCLEAFQLMTARGIRHLAVTDDAGCVLGLATEADLLRDFGIEYYMAFKDVGSVMRSDTCRMRETQIVADAVDVMIEQKHSCVLVVDARERPLGVLTERDVVRLCSDHEQSELLTLGQVMSAPVRAVRPDKPLHEAVDLMETAKIRRLVVVDGAGAVRGLLTHHEIVYGLEGKYSEYFKEFVNLHARDLQRAAPLIDDKLILATILRSTSGTAILAADLDYRICYTTPAVKDILGLEAAEVMGLDLRQTMRQTGWADADNVLRIAALVEGAQNFVAEIGGVKIALRVILMRSPHDRPCGFLLLAQRYLSA